MKLSNDHVVSASQLFVGAVGLGPSRFVLNSSYQNRTNEV